MAIRAIGIDVSWLQTLVFCLLLLRSSPDFRLLAKSACCSGLDSLNRVSDFVDVDYEETVVQVIPTPVLC